MCHSDIKVQGWATQYLPFLKHVHRGASPKDTIHRQGKPDEDGP